VRRAAYTAGLLFFEAFPLSKSSAVIRAVRRSRLVRDSRRRRVPLSFYPAARSRPRPSRVPAGLMTLPRSCLGGLTSRPGGRRNQCNVWRKAWGRHDADDILLDTLEDGAVTVKDITKRMERRVRIRLYKLRVRGLVIREGRGGAYREFKYRLVQRDLAAKALAGKSGLSRGAKVTPEQRM
jgi:hypothetical protein